MNVFKPEIGKNGLVIGETEVQPLISPVFKLKIGPNGLVTLPCTLLALLHLQEGDVFEVHADHDQTFRGESAIDDAAGVNNDVAVKDDGTKAA